MEQIMKNEFISKLEWQTKTQHNKGNSDVTVTISKEGELKFTFRNDIWELITDTEYVVHAICKNRILFKEANQYEGYKLTKTGETKSRYMFTSKKHGKEFIGDYELKYDDFLELYYIEKEI